MLMNEVETGLPNFRQIQGLIKDDRAIEIKLLTGETISGKVFWQDLHCICVRDESEKLVTIWRHAIAYLQLKS
jgi:host factor-I protein